MIRQVETWMKYIYDTCPLVTSRCFKYKHNTQKSIPSIAKLISTVPDSNVKNADYEGGKTPDIFVHVCFNCQYCIEIQ